MKRIGDTIEFTVEEKVNIDTYVDVELDAEIKVDNVLLLITDEEIKEEYEERYDIIREKNFSRTICDLLEIGYHSCNTDEILEMIKAKL